MTKHTAKSSDILLQPMQRQSLVSQAQIRIPTPLHLPRIQKSPCTKSIINTNTNNWFSDRHRILHNKGQIVALVNTATLSVAATVNPEGDGKLGVFVARWSDDVEVEAIF